MKVMLLLSSVPEFTTSHFISSQNIAFYNADKMKTSRENLQTAQIHPSMSGFAFMQFKATLTKLTHL